MWFYDFKLHVFLVLNYVLIYINSKETIIIKSSDEEKQTIFNDVLKNITSANKILQNLIKNYEQLQNIYKSDEESAKSSDSETAEETTIEGVATLKSKESINGNTEATRSAFRGRTQMIFEDDTTEAVDDQSSDSQNNISNASSNLNAKENSNDSVVMNGELSSQSGEVQNANNKLNLISVEDYMKRNDNISERNKINKKVKTRFQIQNADLTKGMKRNLNQNNLTSLRLKVDGKRVKRVVYAEIFSPTNLWQEVISKPIDLRVYSDPEVSFREPSDKKYENLDVKNSESESLSDSIPDEIEKAQLKSYLLRKAYGDACLKVAIRKCYKTLKSVNKIVCQMQSKCKSSLKSSFKENSKKGCIKEFTNGKETKSGDDNLNDIFDRRSRGDADMSRYIELCLPTLTKRAEAKKDDIQHESNDVIAINMLRDRFEKECQKLSAKKCAEACKFATDAACSTNVCGSKKKAFTKNCKRECKRAYDMIKESSESDDDDDDSDDSD